MWPQISTSKSFLKNLLLHLPPLEIQLSFPHQSCLLLLMCCAYLTYIVPRAITSMAFCLFQWQYFEGRQRGGAWLSRYHPSESGHRPRTNMIVVCAHWHKDRKKNKLVHSSVILSCSLTLKAKSVIGVSVIASSPDTRCFSDSMILVTGLLWTVKVWKSWGPDPTVSGCCTITLTAPLLVP